MKVHEIITERIIEKLRQGVIPWTKPWKDGEMPRNIISKKPYKGINIFLLTMSPYLSHWWLTSKQARCLGGRILQKEWYRYTPVVYWNWLDIEDEDGEAKTIPFMRFYKLYNLEQCEGIVRPQEEFMLNNFNPIDKCENIAAHMPRPPQIQNDVPRAYYDSMNDKINLPRKELFVIPEEYYCTLFHELIHSTGHASRLNRKTLTEATYFGSTNYSKEELIAEMGAAFLCGHSGIDNVTIDNSAAYVGGWLRKLKDDSRLVIIAAAQAQKAVDYVLGNTPS